MLETTPDPRTGKLLHPNTVLGYLSSFRGVFTIAVQQFLIATNPMDNVVVGTLNTDAPFSPHIRTLQEIGTRSDPSRNRRRHCRPTTTNHPGPGPPMTLGNAAAARVRLTE